MITTQTLQREVTRLPKRVAVRFDTFELPVVKRKSPPPRGKQIGIALGALAVAASAVYVGRTVRRRLRLRKD
jgi:hypothetical protein